jgi:magnesium-transporting ATPase (P-type)
MSLKKFGAFVFVGLALSPMLALGAATAPLEVPADQIAPGLRSFNDYVGVITTLIRWMFIILLVLAVLFIIMAAFSYMTSGGDEEKVAGAHKKVIYAVVAIAVAFLAQGVSFVVASLLGQGATTP